MMPTPPPRYGPARDFAYRSEGAAIARLASHLGKPLMPHQRYIADVATEYDDNGYHYRTVAVVLPRQSGKTTLMGPIQAHRAITRPRAQVFFTAQTGKDARRRFGDFLQLWEESPLASLGRPRLSQGSEGLHFPNGSAVNVFAPTKTAMHGETPHLVTIDEFWAFDERDGDALLGAIGPAQITLGAHAQLWLISTMGTMQSAFMNKIVDTGRAGDDPTLCYIEYSLADGLDPYAPENWEFHPALGHTITADDLAIEAARQPPSEWERAFMNRRPVHSEPPVIADWDTLAQEQTPPPPGTPIALGFEVGIEAAYSAIVAAWLDDGKKHIRVIKQAPGSWWLHDELERLARLMPNATLAADDGGPNRRVLDAIARDGSVEVRRLSMAERAVADMGLLAAATETGDLDHDGSEALATAVRLARLRTTNGVQTISRDHSAGPVPALIAASVALHAAQPDTPAGPQIW